MSDFATDLIGARVQVSERRRDGWRVLGVGIIRAIRLDGKLTVTIQITSGSYTIFGDPDRRTDDLVTLCPEDCEYATKLTIVKAETDVP